MIKYYTEKQKNKLSKKEYIKNYALINKNMPLFIKAIIKKETGLIYDKFYK